MTSSNEDSFRYFKFITTRREVVPQTIFQTIHEESIVVIPPKDAVFNFKDFVESLTSTSPTSTFSQSQGFYINTSRSQTQSTNTVSSSQYFNNTTAQSTPHSIYSSLNFPQTQHASYSRARTTQAPSRYSHLRRAAPSSHSNLSQPTSYASSSNLPIIPVPSWTWHVPSQTRISTNGTFFPPNARPTKSINASALIQSARRLPATPLHLSCRQRTSLRPRIPQTSILPTLLSSRPFSHHIVPPLRPRPVSSTILRPPYYFNSSSSYSPSIFTSVAHPSPVQASSSSPLTTTPISTTVATLHQSSTIPYTPSFVLTTTTPSKSSFTSAYSDFASSRSSLPSQIFPNQSSYSEVLYPSNISSTSPHTPTIIDDSSILSSAHVSLSNILSLNSAELLAPIVSESSPTSSHPLSFSLSRPLISGQALEPSPPKTIQNINDTLTVIPKLDLNLSPSSIPPCSPYTVSLPATPSPPIIVIDDPPPRLCPRSSNRLSNHSPSIYEDSSEHSRARSPRSWRSKSPPNLEIDTDESTPSHIHVSETPFSLPNSIISPRKRHTSPDLESITSTDDTSDLEVTEAHSSARLSRRKRRSDISPQEGTPVSRAPSPLRLRIRLPQALVSERGVPLESFPYLPKAKKPDSPEPPVAPPPTPPSLRNMRSKQKKDTIAKALHHESSENYAARLYQCADCEYETALRDFFIRHSLDMHSVSLKVPPGQCPKCTFKDKLILSEHFICFHLGIKKLACLFCKREFVYDYSRKSHQAICTKK